MGGEPWTIPRMWAGQPCVILASGPSMSAEVAETVRRAAPYRAIAVNNTYELARWADLLYAADALWWTAAQNRLDGQNNHARTAGFLGLKACAEETPFDDVLRIQQSGAEGWDTDPSRVPNGGGSGTGALVIAAHAGCNPIILCGFDMHGGHWHDRHEYPLRDAGQGIFPKWIARLEKLAVGLKAHGTVVLNATPGSALKCFPMVNLQDAIAARPIAA